MARLVREVRGALGEAATSAPPGQPFGRRWWLAGSVLSLAAALALWQWRSTSTQDQAATPAVPARLPVNGEWRAEVVYDWDNARHVERLIFAGEGEELHGSASFLRVPRVLVEGRFDASGPHFVTRTSEKAEPGASSRVVEHRYRGRLAGDEIRFVMQTEGGSSTHVPVEFVARRVTPGSPQASR